MLKSEAGEPRACGLEQHHFPVRGRLATSAAQRRLIGWFGIRGIGSIYYLTYAINHGLPPELART